VKWERAKGCYYTGDKEVEGRWRWRWIIDVAGGGDVN